LLLIVQQQQQQVNQLFGEVVLMEFPLPRVIPQIPFTSLRVASSVFIISAAGQLVALFSLLLITIIFIAKAGKKANIIKKIPKRAF